MSQAAGPFVFYGDSNTYGFDPRSYLGDQYPVEIRFTGRLAAKGLSVLEEGMNGREIPLRPLERELASAAMQPAVKEGMIFLMLGTNDLLIQRIPDAKKVAERMKAFLEWLFTEEAFSAMGHRFVLVAPPVLQEGSWVSFPEQIEESVVLQKLYEDISREEKIAYLCPRELKREDIHMDGVHFTESGHQKMAEQIFAFYEKYCSSVDSCI